MATSKAQKEIYPFATEDAKAIPLDVIRPIACIKKAIAGAGVETQAIPADWAVAAFYSPIGCLIQFNAAVLVNPPANGTLYIDTLFVPPNCVITSTVLAGDASIISLTGEATYVVMQQIQKWAGLALNRQLNKV